MQNLPTAEVYAQEVKYMPWGILIDEIQKLVIEQVPQNGRVLDLLCGTGHLLGQLQRQRPDIQFIGVDLEPEYIAYAAMQFPEIQFAVADAFAWQSTEMFDAVLCTGGLHHLPYEKQGPFVEKVASLVKPDGFAIVGDPYISDHTTEEERKLAAAQLGYEYLAATIRSGAPDDVIQAAIDLIPNDVLLVEFKTSIAKIRPHFERVFSSVEMHKTWGGDDYGEYYFVLKDSQSKGVAVAQ